MSLVGDFKRWSNSTESAHAPPFKEGMTLWYVGHCGDPVCVEVIKVVPEVQAVRFHSEDGDYTDVFSNHHQYLRSEREVTEYRDRRKLESDCERARYACQQASDRLDSACESFIVNTGNSAWHLGKLNRATAVLESAAAQLLAIDTEEP